MKKIQQREARRLLAPHPDMDESIDRSTAIRAIGRAFDKLSAREKVVLDRRHKEDLTYEEIGKELDVTRERIRQIEAKALRKLRNRIDKDPFIDCEELF